MSVILLTGPPVKLLTLQKDAKKWVENDLFSTHENGKTRSFFSNQRLGAAASSRERAANFRENDADLRGDARHDRTSGHGHETCHQSVFDEVLTAIVFPHSQ